MKNPLLQKSGPQRVRRGGCWYYGARDSRVSFRYWGNASRHDFQGFRLFRSLEKKL